jgi:hypothetical protein
MRRLFLAPIFGLFTLLTITACQSKPPTCSDESTQTELRKAIIDEIEKKAAQLPFGENLATNENFQIFLAGIKITLSEITSDGYNADAKKYTCQAKVVASGSGMPELPSERIAFANQSTEDSAPPGWVLQLNDNPAIVSKLAQIALNASFTQNPSSAQSNMPYTERLYLAQKAAKSVDSSQSVTTQFGTLSVSDEKKLLFNGVPTNPVLEGNNDLSFLDKKSLNGQSVILVQNTGGTACPATFTFVQLSAEGVRLSKEFGTCSELYQLEQIGSKLTLTLPGYAGPNEPEGTQQKAAKKKVMYTFENGVLSEDGKAL